MSFKTASAILKGKWLLDPNWVHAHLPLVVSVLKGQASFDGAFGDEKKEEDHEAKKVLSHKSSAGVYQVGYYTDLSRLPVGSIAMMDITGPVTKYGDMCSYGSVDHVTTISRLANAQNVKGIILNIDSPGGEAAGTQMLADAIKQATKNKPVVAMIDDGMAASAAMWIASAANEIYTTKNTDQVGSVGVYTTLADWYGYFEKEGLKVRDIYAPQSTDKNLDYREALKGNDEPVKADLKVLADQFINTIKLNRAGKLKNEDWATGGMFFSKDAARMGLTDGQKTFDQVVRRMSTMISQREQQNSNIMSFEKTLVAAKAASFEVVDGGFLLEESHLTNIEASITAAATANADLTTQLTAANDAKTTAENDLAAANIKITGLETEVAALKEAPAKSPAATGKEKDDLNDQSKIVSTDPINAEAAKLRAIRNGK